MKIKFIRKKNKEVFAYSFLLHFKIRLYLLFPDGEKCFIIKL